MEIQNDLFLPVISLFYAYQCRSEQDIVRANSSLMRVQEMDGVFLH